MKSTTCAAISVGAAVSAFAITLASGYWVPRFVFDPLNYWFTGLSAFGIPATIIFLGLTLSSIWRKTLAFLAAALLAVPLLPFGLIALSEATNMVNGENLSHIRLAELTKGQVAYRLYRTDCGATCAYGLELRKEIDTLGVVKFVRPIWSVYRQKEGALRLSPTGKVEVVSGELILHAAE